MRRLDFSTRFRAMALSHRDPLARHALFYWMAVRAVRQDERQGGEGPEWAIESLFGLSHGDQAPVADRAMDFLSCPDRFPDRAPPDRPTRGDAA